MTGDEREYVAREDLADLLRRVEELEERVRALEEPGRSEERR